MPSTWIYYIALGLLLVGRVVAVDVPGVPEWLWYQGYERLYYSTIALRGNISFLEYFGGWPLPLFIGTVFCYWAMEGDEENIPRQFLLLPIFFVVFSVAGAVLFKHQLSLSILWVHPLVVIPSGYLYILPWMAFVWMFTKLRLVI